MKNNWNSEQDAVLTDGCIDCFDCTETVKDWTSDLFRYNKTLGPNHLVAHRSTCMTAIQNFWKCQNFRGYNLVPLQLISAHQVQNQSQMAIWNNSAKWIIIQSSVVWLLNFFKLKFSQFLFPSSQFKSQPIILCSLQIHIHESKAASC